MIYKYTNKVYNQVKKTMCKIKGGVYETKRQ